jgi:replication factor C small subunit
VERIFDPILSRCAIFRFYPLPRTDFENQIHFIADHEHIIVDPGILDAIFFITQGDMRQAVNLFQMVAALTQDEEGHTGKVKINPDVIYEISGFLPPRIITSLLQEIAHGKIQNIMQYLKTARSISSRGLIRQLSAEFLKHKLPFPHLEQILEILAEYDYRLSLEADPVIQLDGLFAELVRTIFYH